MDRVIVSIAKDGVDILAALSTPTLAAFVIFAAWQHLRLRKAEVKRDLFERRFEIYEITQKTLVALAVSGRLTSQEMLDFVKKTSTARFVFDEKISGFVEEMRRRATELDTLENERKGLWGKEIDENVKKRKEHREWFAEELHWCDQRFEPYLRL